MCLRGFVIRQKSHEKKAGPTKHALHNEAALSNRHIHGCSCTVGCPRKTKRLRYTHTHIAWNGRPAKPHVSHNSVLSRCRIGHAAAKSLQGHCEIAQSCTDAQVDPKQYKTTTRTTSDYGRRTTNPSNPRAGRGTSPTRTLYIQNKTPRVGRTLFE